MNDTIKEIYLLFKIIKKKKWIKSLRQGSSGIGYTFESLIGKKEDTLPLPDYKDFEIKTLRKYSKRKIHLFSITPDYEVENPIEKALEILGYPDKEYKQFKVLNKDFYANDFEMIGYYRMARLIIDRKKEKIILEARDFMGNNLNLNIFWSFNSIKKRLYDKMKNLVIIEANTKTIKNEEYFFYNKINFYKLKSFETFIDLIENKTISLELKIGVIKKGENFGKTKSRGGIFSIDLKLIEKLYKRIPIELFEYQLNELE